MKRIGWNVAAIAVAMCFAAPAAKAQDSPEATAQKIMAQAREAAGGDAKLKAVQSLSVSGKAKRQVRMMFGGSGGGQQAPPTMQESDFDIDVLAPDKYVRKETREMNTPMGSGTMITFRGFNGDKPIARMETIGDLPNFAQQQQQRQMDPAMVLRPIKHEFVRTWLGWMFDPPAAMGVTFRSTGSETVGNAAYDVVEAAGPENFNAKLYFESASHRLAMIRYKGTGMQQMTRMNVGQPPPQGGNPPQGEGQQQTVFQRPTGPGPEVEFEIAFSDFKAVDGIQLPHKMRLSMNGEVNGETEIKKYKVNSNPKADKFKTTD